MNIRWPEPPRSGVIAAEVKNLSKSYGSLNVLNNVDLTIERGQRIAFVGQNGMGKTTLAKMIVNHLQPTSGEVKIGHNVLIGYYAQNQAEALDPKITLLETMENHSPPEMRTKLRNILGSFLFSGEDQDKKVSVLSGGERARLAMACLLLRPINLLVLDEPTNHLDMLSKEVLKASLLEYTGTMLVVSHDRDFLAGLADITVEFRDKKLYTYLGDINYFLEKRKLDNMRDVELATKSVPTHQSNGKQMNNEERKIMQRNLANSEKKVEQLEAKISDIESQMALADFYTKPNSQKVMDEYAKYKNELETAMMEWMEAQEALG
jgi:ATP-binding cassette, subfamily F, member 3